MLSTLCLCAERWQSCIMLFNRSDSGLKKSAGILQASHKSGWSHCILAKVCDRALPVRPAGPSGEGDFKPWFLQGGKLTCQVAVCVHVIMACWLAVARQYPQLCIVATTSAYVITSDGSPSPALCASSWDHCCWCGHTGRPSIFLHRPFSYCIKCTDIKLCHAANGR